MPADPSVSDFAEAYKDHTRRLLEGHSADAAMSLAIGGNFKSFGLLLRQILVDAGLKTSDYLIDVGCGSGRLAHTLDVRRYLGTDVVPDLLAYAEQLCRKPNWRFLHVDDICIPEADGVADMVCFFSLFTHLFHEDSYRYLLEARRVLRPGGKVVFSFLEFRVYCTWDAFTSMIKARLQGVAKHHDQFISRDAIEAWAAHAGLRIETFFDGDVPHIPVLTPMKLDDGRILQGKASLGQSVCILSRPL